MRALRLIRWAVRVSTVAPAWPARLWALTVALLMPLKARSRRLRERPVAISVAGRRFWLTDRSQLQALEEVFIDAEYATELAAPPAVIVDLGANAGQASVFFRARYPDASIIAVEPDPDTFELLRRNLGKDPRSRIHHAAVTAQPGMVGLTRPVGEGSWMTRLAQPQDHTSVTVRGITLDELLRDIPTVDLMKVDIEGAEREVLVAGNTIHRVEVVVGEMHDWLHDFDRHTALRAFAAYGGFASAEWIAPHLFRLARQPQQVTTEVGRGTTEHVGRS